MSIHASIIYIEEVDIMAQQWQKKTREDCFAIEERIKKLSELIKEVEMALVKNDVNAIINQNLIKAGESNRAEGNSHEK